MNQIFRITVGQDTLQGRLPAVRVGKGYSCIFHIHGVAYAEATPPPKIWIGTSEATTLFWTAEWDSALGIWVVSVGSDAAATTEARTYALTMNGPDGEYIAGQGPFAVYTHVAAGGATGGTAGCSLSAQILALDGRIAVLEDRLAALTGIPAFDPELADEMEMRNQVLAIGNILRGTP